MLQKNPDYRVPGQKPFIPDAPVARQPQTGVSREVIFGRHTRSREAVMLQDVADYLRALNEINLHTNASKTPVAQLNWLVAPKSQEYQVILPTTALTSNQEAAGFWADRIIGMLMEGNIDPAVRETVYKALDSENPSQFQREKDAYGRG